MDRKNTLISYPTPSAETVLISLNPKAGRSDPACRANALLDAVTRLGMKGEISTDLEQIASKANALFASGRLRAVVGVGGDGTAAELVNRTVPGVPITLLPAGTANLIAREFRLPQGTAAAAEMLRTGAAMTLDAGCARFSGGENGSNVSADDFSDERLFLVLASAGIDAQIVRILHSKREKNAQTGEKRAGHIGYLSYIRPIFQAIFSYRYPRMSIDVDQAAAEKSAAGPVRYDSVRWAFICNMARYGFGAAPVVGCRPYDRTLDHCFFSRGGFWPSIFSVLCVQAGKAHRFFPGTKLGTGRTFTLKPAVAGDRIPFELDGDPAGFLPVTIQTVPARVTLVIPDAMARRLAQKESRHRQALASSETACGVETYQFHLSSYVDPALTPPDHEVVRGWSGKESNIGSISSAQTKSE